MKLKKIILTFIVLSLFQVFLPASPKKIEDLTKEDAERLPTDRPSVALVLAGGGAKGFAHLPIMEYIDQLDIPIDMIIGTSIGSIIGGFYAAGYSAKDIVEEFGTVDWSPIFADTTNNPYDDVYGVHSTHENPLSINLGTDFSLKLGTGLSNGQNVYELLKSLLVKLPSDMDFDDLEIPFRAVTTDMLTGDALVLQDGDLAEAMRASMSLPAVFEPMQMDGYYFMDGGLRYNLAINVAKQMGYDIIIAIDISQHVRDNPEIFSSNPTVAILNTITISQYTTTEKLLKEADLVITPDISNFGTMDFKKAEIIYNEGKEALDTYKEPLENIRRRIYPNDYDSNGNRKSPYKTDKAENKYLAHEDLIPEALEIEGAYEKDIKFINDHFNKIKDEPLTRENFEEFINDVYLTGNYKSVRPRLITKDGEQIIDLVLIKDTPKEIKLMMGTDFQQVVSTTTSLKGNLEADFQIRGLSGIGSLIALHGTFLTDLGGELYYLQPFNPYVFLEMKTNYLKDRYFNFANDVKTYSTTNHFDTFGAYANFGIRTWEGNLFRIGGFYKFVNNSALSYVDGQLLDQIVDEIPEIYSNSDFSVFRQYFGASLQLAVSKIDSEVFATKGISVDSVTKLIAPLNNGSTEINPLLLTQQVDATFAIPFGKRFSLNIGTLFGTEFLGNFAEGNSALIPEEGFNSYDRIYFPSINIKERFGTNTVATSISLQYKPGGHLTVFGGDLFLRLEGTAGVVNYDWKDTFSAFSDPDTDYPIIWSGDFGIGVKIKSKFNILARIGICSNYEQKFAPMFCLDMGSLYF